MPHCVEIPVVLLVEDHHDTRQMYAAFMAGRYVTLEAADGGEALQVMQRTLPDVVVTDLSLPDVDGLELFSRMRRDPALASVPVVCLSGYGEDDESGRRAQAAGFHKLLQKPCLPDTLADALDEVLGDLRKRRQQQ